MNTIKNAAEELIVAVVTGIRDIVKPIFSKYTMYYKYIDFFLYASYLLVLFGFYNILPEYIPLLQKVILYTAVFILLLRFNTISWTNPKFAFLGGNTFSEFDRQLIMYTCVFILFTHIVSDTVINYTKNQIQQKIGEPVNEAVVHPIYNYINTSDGK